MFPRNMFESRPRRSDLRVCLPDGADGKDSDEGTVSSRPDLRGFR